ncbi:MAG: peptidase [bacterium]|nr:peptidase [bacterium]
MFEYIDRILKCPSDSTLTPGAGRIIGKSREGRPIVAGVYGNGDTRISLIGGCHADEPVGPRLLRKLCTFLDRLPPHHGLLTDFQWWIVPHANPDGEAVNRQWYEDEDTTFDLVRYLEYVERELPGDDIEFGFPYEPGGDGLRPENDAIYNFWISADAPFQLHASLHGMMVAAGPWFLMEETWIDRSSILQDLCRRETAAMNYRLHDVDRKGEKGFSRISRGFCTRPDSKAMRAFFKAQNDMETMAKFFPSSMEAVAGPGGNPLTIVSEMPLFILPDLPETMEWPNPVWESWMTRLNDWKARIRSAHGTDKEIAAEIKDSGIIPMPVDDQMRLQWRFISAAVEQISPATQVG